jgi:hypothetical protein
VLAGLLILGVLGCGDPDARLRASVRDLQAQTNPPGATLIAVSPITRDAWSVHATWEIEAAMPWQEYTERLSGRLHGFQHHLEGDGRVIFVKSLPDDTYTLRIEAVSIGPPLRIRVAFQASPE